MKPAVWCRCDGCRGELYHDSPCVFWWAAGLLVGQCYECLRDSEV